MADTKQRDYLLTAIGIAICAFAGYVTLTTQRTDWFLLVLFVFGGFLISRETLVDFVKLVGKHWPRGGSR